MQARFEENYINEGDPSILRFLIAARDEVSATQLRDDLLSMLVAGHETTGSVLTWTLYLLANNPDQMQKVCIPHSQSMHVNPCDGKGTCSLALCLSGVCARWLATST